MLLTIAVPTYNRHKQLSFLANKYLFLVAKFYSQEVEIIVLDNSDLVDSELNKTLFKGMSLTYLKNENNIGYANNVLKAVEVANGDYLWIISDDDNINFEEFPKLIEWLKDSTNSANCILLPFENSSVFGKKKIKNTKGQWLKNDSPQEILISGLIKSNDMLPFILFSSAILKIRNIKIELLAKEIIPFTDNDYIQIPLFLNIIGPEGLVRFYDQSMLEYVNSKTIRFDIQRMRESYLKVIDHVCLNFKGVDKAPLLRADEKRWLAWLILDKIDEVNLPGAKEYQYTILKVVFKTKNLKNIILAVGLLTPKPIIKLVFKVTKFFIAQNQYNTQHRIINK